MIQWKIRLMGLLILLSGIINSVAYASARQFAVYQQGDNYEWSVDLSDIGQGQTVYLVLPASIRIDGWSELHNKSLAPLFEYAMPRFDFRYDTFDCWVRELIVPKESLEEPSREGGKILGLSGQVKEPEQAARGQADAWNLYRLNEKERGDFQTGQFVNQQIIRIELTEGLKAEKRILRFRSSAKYIPQVFVSDKGQVVSEGIHLFAMSQKDMMLPEALNSKFPEVNPYLLPPRINQNRRAFQDSIIAFWEGKSSPTLLYSWDIGTAGGDKCAPCIAPPPQSTLLQELGVESDAAHLYISYSIVPPQSERLMIAREYETFQYVFQMNEPAKGFLQCQEAKLYLKEIEARKKIEEENLEALFR